MPTDDACNQACHSEQEIAASDLGFQSALLHWISIRRTCLWLFLTPHGAQIPKYETMVTNFLVEIIPFFLCFLLSFLTSTSRFCPRHHQGTVCYEASCSLHPLFPMCDGRSRWIISDDQLALFRGGRRFTVLKYPSSLMPKSMSSARNCDLLTVMRQG